MFTQALRFNSIRTLAGKFSSFPTVASQMHLRMKAQLRFDDTAECRPSRPDPKSLQLAHMLVADADPVQIFTTELDREAELSPEAYGDLSGIAASSHTRFLAEKRAPTGS
jgi:hypothetical protein